MTRVTIVLDREVGHDGLKVSVERVVKFVGSPETPKEFGLDESGMV